jgi:hypothetical protein
MAVVVCSLFQSDKNIPLTTSQLIGAGAITGTT